MNRMDYCDLHCHSYFSDGSCSPEALVDLAVSADLRALALTDHNAVLGLERFCRAAEGRIEACCGCEITTEADGQELHLLGLFLDPEKMSSVQKVLTEQLERKAQSNRQTIERLAAAGYPVSWAEFEAGAGDGVKNRVHIARYLMKKGIVSEVKQAFAGLLAPGGGFYQETKKLDFFRMIEMLDEIGAVSVWAHPLFHVNREVCEQLLRRAKACGLDGAEVYYSTYSEADTVFMQRMCRQYGLLESGGSDFHGENKPGLALGTGYGGLRVPFSCYEGLKARAEAKRRAREIKRP